MSDGISAAAAVAAPAPGQPTPFTEVFLRVLVAVIGIVLGLICAVWIGLASGWIEIRC